MPNYDITDKLFLSLIYKSSSPILCTSKIQNIPQREADTEADLASSQSNHKI